jgi:hypothetical protein
MNKHHNCKRKGYVCESKTRVRSQSDLVLHLVSSCFKSKQRHIHYNKCSSGVGAGFLRVLRFPLQIFIPPIASQSPSNSSGAGTIGQKWPQYKGLSPTPLAIKKKRANLNHCTTPVRFVQLFNHIRPG